MFTRNLFSICMAKRLHIHLTNVKKNFIQIELFKPNMSNNGLRTPCIRRIHKPTQAQKTISIFFVSVKWFNWQWLSSCEFNDHNCQFKEPYKVFILSVWSAHCLSAHHHWISQTIGSKFICYSIFPMNLCVYPLKRPNANIIATKEAQS